jgi:dipeptide/tripeptide permease
MLVYIMSIPGGMIADKVLGQKAVLLGRSSFVLGMVF